MRKITFIRKMNLILTVALTICLIINSNALSNNCHKVLAASSINASFYLVDETLALVTYPNVSKAALYKVGTGSINYTGTIWDNPSAVKKAIITAPNGINVEWTHILKVNNWYYVGARLTSTNKKYTSTSPSIVNNATKTKESVTHVLNRDTILKVTSKSYPEIDYARWDGFKRIETDVCDGLIPAPLLDDPVFTSMNLPSESVSNYMTSVGRDNGHVYNDISNLNGTHLLGMGGIYATTNAQLPASIKVCLGKIKVFGYNTNTQTWEILSSDKHVADAKIYTLPWETSKMYSVPAKVYEDHLELTITPNDIKNGCLHFWGSRTQLDKNKYKYFAVACSFWAEGSFNNGCLTAVNAIDLKRSAKGETVAQLNSSRGMRVTNYKKTLWSTTIPNNEYKAEWGTELQSLFNQ